MTFKSARTRIFAIFVVAALLVPGLALAGLFDLQSPGAELDPKLVSQLASADPATKTMVFVHGSDIETARRAVSASNMRLVDSFEKVGVAVATGTTAQILAVGKRPGISFVQADEPIEFMMQTSHIATRGEEALQGFSLTTTEPVTNKKGKPKGKQTTTTTLTSAGVDGSGVSLAIIDSGVDGTHPAFQQDGTSKVLKNYKLVCASGVLIPLSGPCTGEQGDAIDETFVDMSATNDTDTPSAGGHGTHVAGITAAIDSDDVPVHGAAPGAKLISLSVGQVISVYGGSAGMNWVLEHHDAPCGEGVSAIICPPIKVINNSWGSGGDYNPEDLRSKIQDALVAEGVTVVWAAGNAGGNGSSDTTNPPGKSPTPGVISVANFDDGNLGTRDGGLATTSSRGRAGTVSTYPDISAPGSGIYSACRPYLAICTSFEEDPDYGTIGGTSMAAPHIAGIVGQLIQAGRETLGRDLDPGEIEDILEDTAYQFAFGGAYEPDLADRNSDHTTSFDKGHGLVDVVTAVARIRGIPLSPGGTVCVVGAPLVTDAQGDASDPSVDLVGADITSEDVAAEGGTQPVLTFRVKVADLTESYPTGSNGVFFMVPFTYDGVTLFVAASRRLVGGIPPTVDQETFTVGQQQGVQLVTLASGLAGDFDFENDEVIIKLTAADLERGDAELTTADLDPLADGAVLSAISVESRTQVSTPAGSLVSVADTAVASCPFVVESSVQPPPPPPPPTPDGSLSAVGDEYSWSGGPTTDSSFVFGCEGLSGSTCDTRRIEIVVPAGGAKLEVSISADLPDVNDFDLYIIGPDGAEFDRSAAEGSNEATSKALTAPGVYTIIVEAFLTVEANYDGVAKLAPLS